MRFAIRFVCWSSLILAAFACGSDPAEPVKAAPAPAAGSVVLPDWAARLCEDWRRPDGSCEQPQIQSDFEECLNEYGLPEQARMQALGVGNRAVQRGRDRATYLCLELRHWTMTPEFHERWVGLPPPRAPKP